MKKTLLIILMTISILLPACAPSLQYIAKNNSKSPKSSSHSIVVYGSNDNLPANAKLLGTLYIGDTGLSLGCGYNDVIILAKKKAREVGGDAIQIIEVNYPDITSTCYRIRANIIAFEEIETPYNWARVNKTETEFRKYFDNDRENLEYIEGIWSVNEGGRWRNPSDGSTGNLPDLKSYRIAIIKDSSYSNYDYIAVVMESEYSQWKPGLIKARFRNTAYDRAFEGVWYMADFLEKKGNYLIDDAGLMKNEMTYYQENFEINTITTFIKAYPQFGGKYTLSADKNLKSSGSGLLLNLE